MERLGRICQAPGGFCNNLLRVYVCVCLRVCCVCSPPVHSEANTRRIRVVEQCFGSNGAVSRVSYLAGPAELTNHGKKIFLSNCLLSSD